MTAWLEAGGDDSSVLSVDVLRIRPERRGGSKKVVEEPSSEEKKISQGADPVSQTTGALFSTSSGITLAPLDSKEEGGPQYGLS